MGNMTLCMAGDRSVRVMRPDGGIEEFQYPVQVAMLMALYPDYLVVHCSYNRHSKTPGEQRKISIMEIESRLVPGQSYILYPIPSQYKQTFNLQNQQQAADRQLSHSKSLNRKLGQLNETKSKARNRMTRKRSFRIRVVVVSLLEFFKSLQCQTKKQKLQERSWPPLLESHKQQDSSFTKTARAGTKKKKYVRPTLEPYIWCPALDCIPESPASRSSSPRPGSLRYQQSVAACYKFQSELSLPPWTPEGLGQGLEESTVSPRSAGDCADVSQVFPTSQSGDLLTGFHSVEEPNSGHGFEAVEREPLLKGPTNYGEET